MTTAYERHLTDLERARNLAQYNNNEQRTKQVKNRESKKKSSSQKTKWQAKPPSSRLDEDFVVSRDGRPQQSQETQPAEPQPTIAELPQTAPPPLPARPAPDATSVTAFVTNNNNVDPFNDLCAKYRHMNWQRMQPWMRTAPINKIQAWLIKHGFDPENYPDAQPSSVDFHVRKVPAKTPSPDKEEVDQTPKETATEPEKKEDEYNPLHRCPNFKNADKLRPDDTTKYIRLSFTPTPTQADQINDDIYPPVQFAYYGEGNRHGVLRAKGSYLEQQLLPRLATGPGQFVLALMETPVTFRKFRYTHFWCNIPEPTIAPLPFYIENKPIYLQETVNQTIGLICNTEAKERDRTKQIDILNQFCRCDPTKCVCRPFSQVFANHTAYYYTPKQIATMIKRCAGPPETRKFQAIVFNFSSFPTQIDGMECTYSHFEIDTESYQPYPKCRVSCKLDGEVAPYDHDAMLWIDTMRGIQLSPTERLTWNKVSEIGKQMHVIFRLIESPNYIPRPKIIDSSVIGTASDHANVANIDVRGVASSTGVENTTMVGLPIVHSYFSSYVLEQHSTLVIFPKDLLGAVASHAVGQLRGSALLRELQTRARQLSKRFNWTPTQQALAIPWVASFAMVLTLQNEVQSMHHVAEYVDDYRHEISHATQNLDHGLDFLDRLVSWATHSRIQYVPTHIRFAGLVAGTIFAAATARWWAPMVVRQTAHTVKGTISSAYGSTWYSPWNMIASAMMALSSVVGSIKTFFKPTQPLFEAYCPRNTRKMVRGQHVYDVETVWNDDHLPQTFIDHHPIRAVLSMCPEGMDVPPVAPAYKMEIIQQHCVETIGTVQVGVGITKQRAQIVRQCHHVLETALKKRALSDNEDTLPQDWNPVFDLGEMALPKVISEDTDERGLVKLNMNEFRARDIDPKLMQTYLEGRQEGKNYGMDQQDEKVSIMQKMENMLKLDAEGYPTTYIGRVIFIMSRKYCGIVNPWMWTYTMFLKKSWNGVMSERNPFSFYYSCGATAEEIGAWFELHYNDARAKGPIMLLEGDSSANDKHMDDAKAHLFDSFLKRFGCPKNIRKAAMAVMELRGRTSPHNNDFHIKFKAVPERDKRLKYGHEAFHMCSMPKAWLAACDSYERVAEFEEVLDEYFDYFGVAGHTSPLLSPEDQAWFRRIVRSPAVFFRKMPDKHRDDCFDLFEYRDYPIPLPHNFTTRWTLHKGTLRLPTGCGQTSVSTTYVLALVLVRTLLDLGYAIEDIHTMFLGDDNASILSLPRRLMQHVTPDQIIQRMACYGFKMTIKLQPDPWNLEYCNQILLPTNHGWVLSPKPGRVLGKSHYCWKNIPYNRLDDWLYTVCLGNRRSHAHVPILRVINQRTMEILKTRGAKFDSKLVERQQQPYAAEWQSVTSEEHEATDATFEWLSARYDLPVAVLRQFEDWLKTNIKSVPCTINHWVTDRIASIDIEYGNLIHIDGSENVTPLVLVALIPFIEECMKTFTDKFVPFLQNRGVSLFGMLELISRLYFFADLAVAMPAQFILAVTPAAIMHNQTVKRPFWQRLLIHASFNALVYASRVYSSSS